MLESAYATPGVAGQRTGQKQVSKGSGTIDSIRSFATGTITFLVTHRPAGDIHAASQHDRAASAAVTVVSSGGGWQVDNIQLSTLGNSLNRRALGPAVVGLAVMALIAFLVVPMLAVGGSSLLFAGGSGVNCNSTVANAQQPAVSGRRPTRYRRTT